MKLNEIKTLPGTYASVKVLEPTLTKLADWCDLNLPAGHETPKDLHVTLLYSRTPARAIPAQPKREYTARVTGFDLFSSDGVKNVLVAKLLAPALVHRREALMAGNPGATHDFPTYEPHVTLMYKFEGDVGDLPKIDFDLLLGNEKIEDLKD